MESRRKRTGRMAVKGTACLLGSHAHSTRAEIHTLDQEEWCGVVWVGTQEKNTYKKNEGTLRKRKLQLPFFSSTPLP